MLWEGSSFHVLGLLRRKQIQKLHRGCLIDKFAERLFIPNSHFKITHMPGYYYISLQQRNGEQK